MQRLHARVCGRVQGVGFREYVRREAAARGLTGYVRNDEDGRTVEVVAEGERADVQNLLDALQEGPRFSRVDRIDSTFSEASRGFSRFSVEF
ncbi:MAG: acylphosphatase [Dehalococcoidia bacterium]|nr:acylphosphatase [Dehalococcoidia bacterium]